MAFEWSPLVEVVVLSLLGAVVTIRLVNTVSICVLSPRVSALRPISLRTPVARFIYWWTMLVGVLVGIIVFSEQHSVWVWAALVLMILGMALVEERPKPEREQRHA